MKMLVAVCLMCFRLFGQDRTARVQLIVTNNSGQRINEFTVQYFTDLAGRDFKQYFVRGMASAIPYGEYTLSVEAGMHKREARSIHVVFPIVTTLVALDYQIEPTRRDVKQTDGKAIKPDSLRGTPYLVVLSVTEYRHGHRQILPLGKDGSFLLFNASLGLHLAALMDDRGLVATRPFVLGAGNHPVQVDFR